MWLLYTSTLLLMGLRSPHAIELEVLKVAHVLDGVKLNVTQNDGYIVSHRQFDYGILSNNSYSLGIDKTLELTVALEFSKINLVFLFIKLRNSSSKCDDYLEISEVKEYAGNKIKFCGHVNYYSKYTLSFTPINRTIRFRFVTNSSSNTKPASGFLIQYAAVVCDIPNLSSDSMGNITLNTTGEVKIGTVIAYKCIDHRYGLIGDTKAICMANGTWSKAKPKCQIIECTIPDSLGDSNSTKFWGPTGNLTVSSTIHFNCSKGYTLIGNRTAICEKSGNWSKFPTCQLKTVENVTGESKTDRLPDTTTRTPTIITTSRTTPRASSNSMGGTTSKTTAFQGMVNLTTPGLQSDKVSDKASNLPMYIGIGVGALAIVVAAMVTLCLCRRRRNRLKKNSIPLNDIDPGAQSTLVGDPDHERGTRDAGGYAGDGDDSGIALHSQVGEPTPAPTSDTNTSTTSSYLLAGELEEEEYGNTETIQRTEQEKNMTDIYSPVMAATKTKKPGTDAVDMVDSEIYG